MISLRTWSVLALGAIGIGSACSPAVSGEDPPLNSSSGGQGQVDTGSGGLVFGMPSGGSVGAPSGGATSSGGSVGTSSGGAQIGTSSGGAAATAVECTAAAFGIKGGYVDNGTICGFGWTATNGAGETIDPPCGSGACFTADELCTSGTLPATDATTETYTGVMIGINAQTSTDGKTKGTWSAAGSIAVSWTAGGLAGEARVMLQVGTTDYCIANAVSGMSYPISSFKTACWGTTGTALAAGAAIDSIVVQYNGTDVDETFTDFCITGVTNQ